MKEKYFIILCLLYLFYTPNVFAQRVPKKNSTFSRMLQNRPNQDSLSIQKVIGKYIKGYYFVHDDYHGTIFNHRNYQNRLISNNIERLLKKDIVGYYDLETKYDSPLKKNVFIQSQEYQDLSERLEKEYQYIIDDTFYISSKIERTDYDLNKKSFTFSVPTNSILYSTTKYVRFGELGIITPLLNDRGVHIKIEDEQTALAVENNYNNCRLVYVFTINKKLSKDDNNPVIGDMQKIFLVNIKNGEIYYLGKVNNKSDKSKTALTQYDNDIYVRYRKVHGYDSPVYFLKTKDGYVQLLNEDEMGFEDYHLEEKGGKYYVTGTNGKVYLLSFKPNGVILAEKDAVYESKCEEIRKDYIAHPNNYEDVTKTDADGVVHSYKDKNGYEWILESENRGFHLLESENVYILFEDQKFVRKKHP